MYVTPLPNYIDVECIHILIFLNLNQHHHYARCDKLNYFCALPAVSYIRQYLLCACVDHHIQSRREWQTNIKKKHYKLTLTSLSFLIISFAFFFSVHNSHLLIFFLTSLTANHRQHGQNAL